MIAVLLLYVSFGMLTSVVTALICEVEGSSLQARHVLALLVLWPLMLAVLFVKALEVSE